MTMDRTRASGLSAQLNTWVSADLITADQAQRITDWETRQEHAPASAVGRDAVVDAGTLTAGGTAPRPPVPHDTTSRQSTLIEALAYVGGAVIAAALLIIMFGYFDQLSQPVQLAMPAVAAAVLLASGAIIPQRLGPLGIRMRSALWFAAVIAVAGLTTVVADVVEMDAPTAPRLVAVVAALVAVTLWMVHRVTAQHVAAFVAMNGLVSALVYADGLITGLVMTALAAVWVTLSMYRLLPGQGRWLPPQLSEPDTHRLWGIRIAAVAAGVAGIVIAASWESTALGLVPVLAVIVLAVTLTDVALVTIGAVAGLIVIPMIADHYFHSTIATAVVLLVAGGLLLTLAILIARRRSNQ